MNTDPINEQAECVERVRAAERRTEGPLPCPFCGSEARHDRHASGAPVVICTNGQCGAMLLDVTPMQAKERWNTRALPPEQPVNTDTARLDAVEQFAITKSHRWLIWKDGATIATGKTLREAIDAALPPEPEPPTAAPATLRICANPNCLISVTHYEKEHPDCYCNRVAPAPTTPGQHAEEVAMLTNLLAEETAEADRLRRDITDQRGDLIAAQRERTAALAAQAELMQQLADIHDLATPPALTDSQVFTATPESEDLEETMDVVTADFARTLEARLAAIAERTRPTPLHG